MNRFKTSFSHLFAGAAVAATLFSLAGSARADALPPDACLTGAPGDACHNATANYSEPGICTESTCMSPAPDGGSRPYGCLICEVNYSHDAGADGGTTTSSSKGGCTMSPGERDGATGLAMLALGALGLALSRRNKKRA